MSEGERKMNSLKKRDMALVVGWSPESGTACKEGSGESFTDSRKKSFSKRGPEGGRWCRYEAQPRGKGEDGLEDCLRSRGVHEKWVGTGKGNTFKVGGGGKKVEVTAESKTGGSRGSAKEPGKRERLRRPAGEEGDSCGELMNAVKKAEEKNMGLKRVEEEP